MYFFAICDDEPLFVRELAQTLKNVLEKDEILYQIDQFFSETDLLNALDGGRTYTALFLDILMEGKGGIQTARELRDRSFGGAIIFISVSPDYALQSFDAAPVHYLLKPIGERELREALRRVFLRSHKKPSPLVISDAKNARKVVAPEEIVYIEVFRIQIVIHLRDGLSITGVGALRDLHSRLDANSFYLCHRSFIVNFNYVAAIRRYEFVLKDGGTVPIAKNRYDKAMLAMTEYLKK